MQSKISINNKESPKVPSKDAILPRQEEWWLFAIQLNALLQIAILLTSKIC
jgi:hypothetical protein